MEDQSRPRQDISVLDAFAERLLQLVARMMPPRLHYGEGDHLGFMALCFTSKQMEHLLSVRALVRAGNGRDAALIVRSMIEGLSLLKWAALEPSRRPLLWRTYAWVEDWRLMRDKEEAGEIVEASAKRDILQQIQQYGPMFYTSKAEESQRTRVPLQREPYWPTWHEGKSVRDIFEQVPGAPPLYRYIYRETSGWNHWSPRGLGAAIRREGEETHYTLNTPAWAATALAAGFQALIESAILLDSHLKLRFDQQLSALRDEYVQRLSAAVP